MNATHLVPRWAEITREERFFTCMLFHDLRQEPDPAWAILSPRLGCADGIAVTDVGFEICFFRDVAFKDRIGRRKDLEKQTFDLVLTLSDQSLVIIEAKAQQPFSGAQIKTLHRARDIMQASTFWPVKQIYLVGLCSSRCMPRASTCSQLDGLIRWREMADAYPNQQAIYLRADQIYRDRPS